MDVTGICGDIKRRNSFMTTEALTTPHASVDSQANVRASNPASPAKISNSTKARSPLGCLSMRSRTRMMGRGKSQATKGGTIAYGTWLFI